MTRPRPQALSRCRKVTPPLRRLRAMLCLVLILAILPPATLTPPASAADQSRKYAVIAAFLYNFLLYVDWPEEGSGEGDPLRIGVLGSNPFGGALEAMQKKTVRGRPIVISVHESVDSLEPCHILFIPGEQDENLEAVRRAMRDKPVLIVGESSDFTRLGGVARFFSSEKTQRMVVEINQPAADASQLKIRSKLMRLASVVSHPLPALEP